MVQGLMKKHHGLLCRTTDIFLSKVPRIAMLDHGLDSLMKAPRIKLKNHFSYSSEFIRNIRGPA